MFTKKSSRIYHFAKIITATCFAFIILFSSLNALAQTPLTFKDSQGRAVTFPFGAASFADRVEERKQGNPPSTAKTHTDPNNTLGVPDYKGGIGSLSLGNNGSVTVEFTDNYLVDMEGPDLWIFEIGPAVESTKLAISKDGRNWIEIGTIKGSTSGIDIAPFVKRGDRFSFVRVTDNNNGGGSYAGADIDAIGAIGSIAREPDDINNNTHNMPKLPTDTSGNGCCNTLRVEKTNGSIEIVDLSNGKRLTNFSNIRSISYDCGGNTSNVNTSRNTDGNSSRQVGGNSDGRPIPQSEIEKDSDFLFVSINGKAVSEATRICNVSLAECGAQRIGYYGYDDLGYFENNDGLREDIFTYRDHNNKSVGVYLLTLTGMQDDSITGERLRLQFFKEGNSWQFYQGGRQFQCGRGNMAGKWTKELCP